MNPTDILVLEKALNTVKVIVTLSATGIIGLSVLMLSNWIQGKDNVIR